MEAEQSAENKRDRALAMRIDVLPIYFHLGAVMDDSSIMEATSDDEGDLSCGTQPTLQASCVDQKVTRLGRTFA